MDNNYAREIIVELRSIAHELKKLNEKLEEKEKNNADDNRKG